MNPANPGAHSPSSHRGDSVSSSRETTTRFPLDDWMEAVETEHVPRSDLNQIVLDYLINAGHKDAAVKFAREAGIVLTVDVGLMDNRVKILDAAHDGRIADCMKLLEETSPDLLEYNMDVYVVVMKQMLLELIRERKISEALQYAQDVLAEKGAEDPTLLEDFERALALLAFDKPEESPYGDLLDLSKREEVKAQLNETMLAADGRSAESKLALICKMLLWSQDDLKKRGVTFPRLTDLATGLIVDNTDRSSGESHSVLQGLMM
ncbi:putative Glucose-induced degradation protein 8-like protein [Hypsibius exemplaris]|uniref:Glucose-induced degradation protein 8-like protein n=1 Tax=Hypsibius exemplaris TaxID=2072580 RepID=A0A1W0WPY0_HYPEX|nr:putative Glucose-induced degradation protein 8-like protein [Hypsibius exemplaris]